MMSLDALERKIGYPFHKPPLLEEAITHASFSNENRGAPDNRRLAWLGDAVLRLAVSQALVDGGRQGATPEALHQARENRVTRAALVQVAQQLDLATYLRIGRGHQKHGISNDMLAECVEAILGAICMDGGAEEAVQAAARLVS